MSLPRLKGAISGPIRAYRLTVTAAHFSAYGGGEGENEKEAGGGGRSLFCLRHEAVRCRLDGR